MSNMTMFILQLKLMLISLLAVHWSVSADPCNSEGATATGTNRLWPGGIVPYVMNTHFSDDIYMAVKKQIKHWELSTCIRFMPRTSQYGFVFFIPGERSCASFGYGSESKHEVSLSPSVSTNITELNTIFIKILGIGDAEPLSSKKHTTVFDSSNSGGAVKSGGFLSKKSAINNNYLCQETCGNSIMIKNVNMKPLLITSPGYPNLYEANVECVWSIYNTEEKPLSISFADIHVERQPYGCNYDYVDVVEVNATGRTERGKRLCDNYYDTITVKKGSKLSIRFHSDYAENGKGFKAHIFREQQPHCTLNNGGCAHICVPFGTTRKCQCTAGYKLLDDGVSCGDIDECGTNNGGCAQQCVNTNGSYHCKCHLGYSRNPDNITCERCHETYTNKQSVIISSPGYPGVYTPFHNCVWKIISDKPHYYIIHIANLNLNYSPDCKMDYLKISNHADKLTLPNNGRLCGIHSRVTIVSRTSNLMIHFRSRARGGTGFRLTYLRLTEESRKFVEIDGMEI